MRSSSISATVVSTSESREINRFARTHTGNETVVRRIRRVRRSERICTTRWREPRARPRFSPRRFSHAIETNVLKCTHAARGECVRGDLSASVCVCTTRAHIQARLAEMEDSVVRRYPGGISHREISISAFLSTIPRSRTDYPLIRAGQRRGGWRE